MSKYKVGKIVKGTVTGIEPYGAFVSFDEYYSGLIHISEISSGFVRNVNDFVKIGETIYIEVLSVDEKSCHLKLSIKNIDYKAKSKNKKRNIVETVKGFTTLEVMLPIWINEKISKLNL